MPLSLRIFSGTTLFRRKNPAPPEELGLTGLAFHVYDLSDSFLFFLVFSDHVTNLLIATLEPHFKHIVVG